MNIQIDSREKERAITRIVEEFDQRHIYHFTSKMVVGDYMNWDNPKVAVDRKQSLGEICTNLCSGDKTRFWKEVRLAKRLGIKLIVLCEQGGGYHSIADVANWSSEHTRVSGRDLMEKIFDVHISYGVEFLFCDKRQTGKRIVELLGGQNA